MGKEVASQAFKQPLAITQIVFSAHFKLFYPNLMLYLAFDDILAFSLMLWSSAVFPTEPRLHCNINQKIFQV